MEYDPKAQSVLFSRFLERVLPCPEVRSFVQRVAGYSLLGRNPEEILIFMYGPPASGKSTFLAAVSAALGDYAATADFGTFLKRNTDGGPRNEIARLAGVRLVSAVEVDHSARLDVALINQLTGGDRVAARFLYREAFEFVPQFTLWLAANNRPTIQDPGNAIWRRLCEVPFDVAVPHEERDPHLKQQLMSNPSELKAVFNWLVQGCLAYQQDGLRIPDAVKSSTEDYYEEMDEVAQFLEDCTVTGPEYWERGAAVYSSYRLWCSKNAYTPMGSKTFSQKLTGKGLDQLRKFGGRGWAGIRLRSGVEAQEATSDSHAVSQAP